MVIFKVVKKDLTILKDEVKDADVAVSIMNGLSSGIYTRWVDGDPLQVEFIPLHQIRSIVMDARDNG